MNRVLKVTKEQSFQSGLGKRFCLLKAQILLSFGDLYGILELKSLTQFLNCVKMCNIILLSI